MLGMMTRGRAMMGAVYARLAVLALLGSMLAGCVSQALLNKPLAESTAAGAPGETLYSGGYRFGTSGTNDSSAETIVILALSGGGTRSAALSYGVLKGLRDTTIVVGGRERRLLDELDLISSVSGGSMIAAYYALKRDRTFPNFESDFLHRDIDAYVYGIYLLPWNWAWLFDPNYGTNDAMQQVYDRLLYHGATYRDLAQRGQPLLMIQATDISFGNHFSFNQETFDILCSDLASLPVSRAVAASAGVPILFTPITLQNYTDRCGNRGPAWLTRAMAEHDPFSRQRAVAASMSNYLDGRRARYVHLLDGGVADNLALRGVINGILALGNQADRTGPMGLLHARRLLLISVDGQGQSDDSWARSRTVTGLSQILNSVSGAQMNNYNFETMILARQIMNDLAVELAASRCREARVIDGHRCDDVRSYFAPLGLSYIADPERRRRLQLTPTALTLPRATTDELTALGEAQVHASPVIAEFIRSVASDTAPERPPPRARRAVTQAPR